MATRRAVKERETASDTVPRNLIVLRGERRFGHSLEGTVTLRAPPEAHLVGQLWERGSHRPPLVGDIGALEEEGSRSSVGKTPVTGHDHAVFSTSEGNDLVVRESASVDRVAADEP